MDWLNTDHDEHPTGLSIIYSSCFLGLNSCYIITDNDEPIPPVDTHRFPPIVSLS